MHRRQGAWAAPRDTERRYIDGLLASPRHATWHNYHRNGILGRSVTDAPRHTA
ncbi:MAG: hypothetical protein ABIP01_05245 [Candidatus Limnocylindria bacterium]